MITIIMALCHIILYCSSLKPSTRYYYVVGSKRSTVSRQFSFKTPPNPSSDAAINIVAFGGMYCSTIIKNNLMFKWLASYCIASRLFSRRNFFMNWSMPTFLGSEFHKSSRACSDSRVKFLQMAIDQICVPLKKAS